MKIELNEGAAIAIVAIAFAFVAGQVASCSIRENDASASIDKAAIAAGFCRDNWGKWVRCR